MIFDRPDPAPGEPLRILDESGRIVRPDLVPDLPPEDLRRAYGLMVLTRLADQKALNLQRQGRMGTFASSRGHEACQVGTALAAKPDDWVFPYFRDLGLYLTLGYPLWLYYHFWMGNEAGLRAPDGLNIFPLAIPVGSQILHAVGAGMAARSLRKPLAAFVTFGDGATSQGDFHEGLNFAGVFKTPNVFVCYNNQWAISTPRSRQTASATIGRKAAAYGFPGTVVDGNDVLGVYAAVREAAEAARAGRGPSLVEAVTYRMGHHTTSDDATRYRTEAEVREWERRDPIPRFRAFLEAKGAWDGAFEKAVQERATAEIEGAVEKAENAPAARPEDLFAFTFRDMPPRLRRQLAALAPPAEGGGR